MDCNHCNLKLKILDLKHTTVHYCDNCFTFIEFISTGNCCEKPDLKLVRSFLRDGRPILYRQCKCGFVYTNMVSYKNDKTIDINSIDLIDKESDILRKKTISKEISDFRMDFELKKMQLIVIPEQDDYYSSNEWKSRRKLVLDRDKHICQSCLSNNATQVHHLTYKHFKNEPLFDLISVCQFCHEQITKMDREDKSVQNIKISCL